MLVTHICTSAWLNKPEQPRVFIRAKQLKLLAQLSGDIIRLILAELPCIKRSKT